jgi:hypothetical protein
MALEHIVAGITLVHIVAIMTLDCIVALDTIVVFLIPSVALLTSSPVMSHKEHL